MSEIRRKRLQELRFESTNMVVVALIIGKTTPRSFKSKRSADTMAVLTFTVRDSKQFFTNCICWGSDSKINDYYHKYRLGDLIDIISPQVTPISQSGREFHPKTSTPFALTVNEGNASIEPHSFDTTLATEIRSLARQPIKPVNLALSLADVSSSGSTTSGQFVDLFVAVRQIRPVRTITARRTGEQMRCIEVIVTDRSYPAGMLFSIWHEEWIERAEKRWKPNETVLYLIDVRLDYSTFYKRPVLSFTSKTVILEDPNVKETQQLVEHASTVSLTSLDFAPQSIPDPNTITTVMTVQQIYDRSDGAIRDDSDQFTAVIYGVVTRFDLDGSSRCVSKRCKYCKRITSLQQDVCSNDQCQMDISFNSSGLNSFEFYFDINIHLTDHTGTLTECRLMNNFAEAALSCTTQQFQFMKASKRTELKWKFLMERVCTKVVVKKKSVTRMNLFIMILDMKPIGLDEVAENVLVY